MFPHGKSALKGAVPKPDVSKPDAARPNHGECRALAEVLDRIGDKWTVMVVGRLADGPVRFNELLRQVGGVSQRMLTLTLRGLERDGIVERSVRPTNPPQVEYALSAMGRSLIVPLTQLLAWAKSHRSAIERSRAAYEHARSTDQPAA